MVRCECGNFARPERATCNACKSEEELLEEREKREKEEAEGEAERRVIDALPDHSKCECGAFARRWKSFQEFELFNCGAEDFSGAIEEYKTFLEEVKRDPSCNACHRASNGKRKRK